VPPAFQQPNLSATAIISQARQTDVDAHDDRTPPASNQNQNSTHKQEKTTRQGTSTQTARNTKHGSNRKQDNECSNKQQKKGE
jgi:hypothetical protein